MKKRSFATLACALALTLFCIFPVSATSIENINTEKSIENVAPVTEAVKPEVNPSVEDNDGKFTFTEKYNTLFTRIWEYVNANSTKIIGIAGDAAIFILAVFFNTKNNRKAKTLAGDLMQTKSDTYQILNGQGSVVEAVNGMIDAYNNLSEEYQKLKKSYDEYGATEGDRNRVVGALVAQNTAILEILTTVYVNSKNLPQGVKDLVNLKYANCLKSLEDDEQLKAIVEAVRNKIGTNMITEEEAETTKAEQDRLEV